MSFIVWRSREVIRRKGEPKCFCGGVVSLHELQFFYGRGGGHAHLNYIDGLLGSQNVTTFEFQHFSQHNTKKREDNKQTVQRKQSPIQARKTTTDDRRKEHHQTTYLSGTPQPLQLDTTSRSYAVPLSPSIRGSGQLNGD
jgi:hypothetical protein